MSVARTLSVAGAALCAVALVGCMTYDFEPVQPLAISQSTQTKKVIAKQLKPNIMILLDKSGSMSIPVPAATCTGGGACTRLTEMKAAMRTFLTASGTLARFGLATYPLGNTQQTECTASGVSDIRQPLPSSNTDTDQELQALATSVNNSIQGVDPAGGTPTGGSLRALGGYSALLGDEREDFVLLLTDGLPNCNANNPNTYDVATDATLCRCTLSTGGNPPVSGCAAASYSKLGCLDKDNSVQAIYELASKKIRTVVIGFSGDVASGAGEEVLNAMAQGGGLPRTCPNGTNAECGSNNTCNAATKTCQKAFYQTGNSTELAAALTKIANDVTVGDPCVYKLDTVPSDPKLLSVLVDGKPISSGNDTWIYSAGTGTPTVTFKSSLCTTLSSATPQQPVNLEFRIIEGL
jgi:hypothetical protein